MRRITFQPGNELLSGTLLVPVVDGFFEIAAIARAATTGMRESVLLMARTHGKPFEPGTSVPSQAEYDAPAHDHRFPDHPLTLVRAALRWLQSDAAIEVLSPAPDPPSGEIVVEAASCAVVLPPRYVFVPREVMPMAPTLASYTRVALGEGVPRMLDVWRLEGRITQRDRARRLKELALEMTADWEKEGVSDLEQEAEIVASDTKSASVRGFARFFVGAKRKLSALRWRADEDGVVFRVSASGPAHLSEEALRNDADAVMSSLRRLDASPPSAPPEDKPWWKVW